MLKHATTRRGLVAVLAGPLGALALALVLAGSALAQDTAELAAEVERGMALWHVPGMAVAVVSDEDVMFTRGFGKVGTGNATAVDEHTLFAIASTTKAMVVAALLMLADDGKLELDDRVTRHIPELRFHNPALTKQATLRDLLAHRTGLPSTDVWTFLQAVPLEEQIRLLEHVEQDAPARSRLIYQNTMYELAGLVIERVSGQPWHGVLDDRLWKPLGMNETYGARGGIPEGRSHVLPYVFVNDELVQAEWDFPADFADAAGSVWSSVHDMSRWAQFLLRGGVTEDGKRLISEAAFEQMFEPHQLASDDDFYPTTALTTPNWRSYGLGWFQQDFQGRKIDFHTGSLSGLIAIVGLDRARDRAVIVLGNRDHAEMRHALLWYTLDETDGSQRRDWNQDVFDLYETSRMKRLADREESESSRLPGTLPALSLDGYAGTYRNPLLGDVSVLFADGELTVHFARKAYELRHWHLQTFQMVDERTDFRAFSHFLIDAQGEAASFIAFDQPFKRVPPDTE